MLLQEGLVDGAVISGSHDDQHGYTPEAFLQLASSSKVHPAGQLPSCERDELFF